MIDKKKLKKSLLVLLLISIIIVAIILIRNTLARYEHGAPVPSEVLKKMCIIYQKSADYLIGNTNDNYYDVQIMRLLEQNDMKTNKAIYEIVERIMKISVAY